MKANRGMLQAEAFIPTEADKNHFPHIEAAKKSMGWQSRAATIPLSA